MAVIMHTQPAALAAARPSNSSTTEPRSELEVATRSREDAARESEIEDDDLYSNLAHTD